MPVIRSTAYSRRKSGSGEPAAVSSFDSVHIVQLGQSKPALSLRQTDWQSVRWQVESWSLAGAAVSVKLNCASFFGPTVVLFRIAPMPNY
jgi:hypothetical protein